MSLKASVQRSFTTEETWFNAVWPLSKEKQIIIHTICFNRELAFLSRMLYVAAFVETSSSHQFGTCPHCESVSNHDTLFANTFWCPLSQCSRLQVALVLGATFENSCWFHIHTSSAWVRPTFKKKITHKPDHWKVRSKHLNPEIARSLCQLKCCTHCLFLQLLLQKRYNCQVIFLFRENCAQWA